MSESCAAIEFRSAPLRSHETKVLENLRSEIPVACLRAPGLFCIGGPSRGDHAGASWSLGNLRRPMIEARQNNSMGPRSGDHSTAYPAAAGPHSAPIV
jgi:hypothetical protein